MKNDLKPFSLPIGKANGITQTLISGAVRFKTPIIDFKREMLQSEDGGEFAIDWGLNLEETEENSPIILIFHGLAGGGREPYIQRFVHFAMKEKFKICVLTNRGCAGTKMKTPKAYNSAFFDDAMTAIKKIHSLYPKAPINLVGFSLGANTCIGLSSRYSDFCKSHNVSASVSISPSPFLISMMLSLCPALNEQFSSYELKLVKKNVQVFQDAYDKGEFFQDIQAIYNSKSMKQFDDIFTSKNFNYGHAVNYYYDIEQFYHFMPKSFIPIFSLNAMDDPVAIMTHSLVQRYRNLASVSPFYTPLITKTGGHLSWTFKEGHKGYYDDLTLNFLKKMNEMFFSGELNKIQEEFINSHSKK